MGEKLAVRVEKCCFAKILLRSVNMEPITVITTTTTTVIITTNVTNTNAITNNNNTRPGQGGTNFPLRGWKTQLYEVEGGDGGDRDAGGGGW